MPPVVRVSPDHWRTVLFGDTGCVTPAEVGISDDLAKRLLRWSDVWELEYTIHEHYAWPTDADRVRWHAEGEALVDALNAEFGGRIRFVGGFDAPGVLS